MVENFDKMLAGSLRLEDPWYIIGAEFNEEEPAIHIHVGVDKTAVLSCLRCADQTVRLRAEGTYLASCGLPVLSLLCPLQASPYSLRQMRHSVGQCDV